VEIVRSTVKDGVVSRREKRYFYSTDTSTILQKYFKNTSHSIILQYFNSTPTVLP
jgi:hypothetical protein